MRRLAALALAGGDFPVDLGLLAVRACVVATDVSFEAVELCPGAIECVPHPPERLVAPPQARAGQRIAVLIKPLVALVSKALALVGTTLALVATPVAVVGDALTRIGKCFALVGGTIPFVCAMLLLAYLAPQQLDTHGIRASPPRPGFSRAFLTDGSIRTIWTIAHSSSMRLCEPFIECAAAVRTALAVRPRARRLEAFALS